MLTLMRRFGLDIPDWYKDPVPVFTHPRVQASREASDRFLADGSRVPGVFCITTWEDKNRFEEDAAYLHMQCVADLKCYIHTKG